MLFHYVPRVRYFLAFLLEARLRISGALPVMIMTFRTHVLVSVSTRHLPSHLARLRVDGCAVVYGPSLSRTSEGSIRRCYSSDT